MSFRTNDSGPVQLRTHASQGETWSLALSLLLELRLGCAKKNPVVTHHDLDERAFC